VNNNGKGDGSHYGSDPDVSLSGAPIAWQAKHLPEGSGGQLRRAGDPVGNLACVDGGSRLLRELEAARADIEEAIRQVKARLAAQLDKEVQDLLVGIASDSKPWSSTALSGPVASAVDRRESKVTFSPLPFKDDPAEVAKSPLTRTQEEPMPPFASFRNPAPVPDRSVQEPEPKRAETALRQPREAARETATTATAVVTQEMEEPSNGTTASLSPDGLENELFEGTVHLDVNVKGCPQQTLQFVDELFQTPKFKVRRMIGDNKGKLDLWVGLREPLALGGVIGQMKTVSHVRSSPEGVTDGTERTLSVWLSGSQPAAAREMRPAMAWGRA